MFQSSPAATSLNFIGGPAILLGLIAMARDDHTMYAAVKVLTSILNSSPMSEKLMRHMHGYQVDTLLFIPSGYSLSHGEKKNLSQNLSKSMNQAHPGS